MPRFPHQPPDDVAATLEERAAADIHVDYDSSGESARVAHGEDMYATVRRGQATIQPLPRQIDTLQQMENVRQFLAAVQGAMEQTQP